MEEENILQLIISSENIPIITDPDLETQNFNSYSRGYHAYMNLWIPSIEDKSLICQKEKGNEYELLLEITLLDVCPKIYVIIFGNSISTQVLGKRVNGSAGYGLEIPVCFLFSMAMSREQHG